MTIKVEKEVDVKFLRANCGVRYWDDAEVNGEVDEDGSLIPCRNGDSWCPLICIESGIIINWEQGKTAKIHYKVCDAGVYALLDSDEEELVSIDGYVPDMLCPKESGYGDYVIMDIDQDGRIAGWKPHLDCFLGED